MAERYLSEYSVIQAVGDVHPLDYNAQGIVERIKAIPAADVVEVVRCGDCIRKDICRTSNVWAVSPDDNWFCADGERKEGGPDA